MTPARCLLPACPVVLPLMLVLACDSGGMGTGMGLAPGSTGGPPPIGTTPPVTGTTPPSTTPPPGMTPPGMTPPPANPMPPGQMGVPGQFVEKPCAFMTAPMRPTRCGTVTVPEARDGSSTRTIQLSVVIVKSDSATPAPDPLVFLQGGPGGGGTDFTAALTRMAGGPFEAVLANRDVLSIDQRGTGRSVPLLDCPEANMPGMMGMMPPPGMVVDINSTPLGKCRTRLTGTGIDLNQYTTANAADDVEDVRKALGYKQWNLLGGSYGTRLALEVVRRHPAGVRTLLLDSVAPPDVDLLAEAGPNNVRVLEAVFSGCAAQAECNRAYPELGKVYTQVVGGLNTMPARLLGGLLPLDGNTFLQLSLLLLRSPTTAVELPEIVFQAQEKKFMVIERLLLQLVQQMMGGGGGANSIALGLHLSVICSDYLPFTSREKMEMNAASISPELRAPLLQASLGYLENCRIWNVRPSPATVNQAVTSPVQTLVLAGSMDPATPPAWAQRAASTLSASHFFELKGVSHGVFPTPCGRALLAPFLDNPATKPAPACLGTLTDVQYRVQR
jgi:pimeloyl-ACP methyl ester carboxylesterase